MRSYTTLRDVTPAKRPIGGVNHDVLLYSLLRTDPRPWHSRAEALSAASGSGNG
jgi:hypothetical protein